MRQSDDTRHAQTYTNAAHNMSSTADCSCDSCGTIGCAPPTVCSGHRPFSEPEPEHSGAAAKSWCRCARVDWVQRVRRMRLVCLSQVCDREPQGRDRHDDVGASSAWHAGARSIGFGHHRPALQRRTCLVVQKMRRAGGRMQSRWQSCSCSLAGRWRMARCTTAWTRATATPTVGLTRPRGRGRC